MKLTYLFIAAVAFANMTQAENLSINTSGHLPDSRDATLIIRATSADCSPATIDEEVSYPWFFSFSVEAGFWGCTYHVEVFGSWEGQNYIGHGTCVIPASPRPPYQTCTISVCYASEDWQYASCYY